MNSNSLAKSTPLAFHTCDRLRRPFEPIGGEDGKAWNEVVKMIEMFLSKKGIMSNTNSLTLLILGSGLPLTWHFYLYRKHATGRK